MIPPHEFLARRDELEFMADMRLHGISLEPVEQKPAYYSRPSRKARDAKKRKRKMAQKTRRRNR